MVSMHGPPHFGGNTFAPSRNDRGTGNGFGHNSRISPHSARGRPASRPRWTGSSSGR